MQIPPPPTLKKKKKRDTLFIGEAPGKFPARNLRWPLFFSLKKNLFDPSY